MTRANLRSYGEKPYYYAVAVLCIADPTFRKDKIVCLYGVSRDEVELHVSFSSRMLSYNVVREDKSFKVFIPFPFAREIIEVLSVPMVELPLLAFKYSEDYLKELIRKRVKGEI